MDELSQVCQSLDARAELQAARSRYLRLAIQEARESVAELRAEIARAPEQGAQLAIAGLDEIQAMIEDGARS